MKGVAPPPVTCGIFPSHLSTASGARQDRRRVALCGDHARVGLDLGMLLLVERLLHALRRHLPGLDRVVERAEPLPEESARAVLHFLTLRDELLGRELRGRTVEACSASRCGLGTAGVHRGWVER